MPELIKTHHIFITHSWCNSDSYKVVKKWLNNANNFSWCDHSVPFFDPFDADADFRLKQEIAKEISACGCVVILSQMYGLYSRWIEYVIDTTIKLGKPIIGVKPWGEGKIPGIVADNANIMADWNSSSVVRAIRDHSL